jgi:hypothetical protein
MNGLLDGIFAIIQQSIHPLIRVRKFRCEIQPTRTINRITFMASFLADATNEQIGIFIFAGAVVDKIEVDLDDKTAKIHKRVNRLLAGQMLIAGRVGCSLDQHQDQITAWMAELDREEE